MQGKSKRIQCTTDYTLFVVNRVNRVEDINPELEKSMLEYGFLSACAIHVFKTDNGKLLVKDGHHRLRTAKKLGLPVWYIIEDVDADMMKIVRTSKGWTTQDYVTSHRKSGNPHYIKLEEFRRENNIPLAVAAELLAGRSAGSVGMGKKLRNGTYKTMPSDHAVVVMKVVNACREEGIKFADTSPFIMAVSSSLRVKQFDVDYFISKVKKWPKIMQRRARRDEYVDEIESLYNYRNKLGQQPIAFESRHVMRKRRCSFGRASVLSELQ